MQYGTQWTCIVPANVYGPHDHFGSEQSHVVPALVTRLHNARVQDLSAIVLWGTGNARRQFVYSRDLARIIVQNIRDPRNCVVSGMDEVSIADLVSRVARVVGYTGTIAYEGSSDNDGQARKYAIDDSGNRDWTSLDAGLEETYGAFLDQLSRRGQSDEVKMVLERKTFADLLASIKDGRFRQQRERLLQFARESPGTKLLYVLEGGLPRSSTDASVVMGALENLAVIHGIPVLTTFTVAQTCASLKRLVQKIGAESSTSSAQDTLTLAHMKSRKAVPTNPLATMLCTIDGVGPKIALALSERFRTMQDLVCFLATQDLGNELVGKRRIGGTIAKAVRQALMS
ncbi:hypothetical protein GGF32_005346 [Allomyces javanicus]|nr:hypothetical protein GGF32_005346 [Allomyces javanicus]